MPNPNRYSSQENYMSDCVAIKEDEGEDHETAVAICLSEWANKDND